MRKVMTGEQVVRVSNPDPFGFPRWRPPVYETPGIVLIVVQLARLTGWLVRLVARHPIADLVLIMLALGWVALGAVDLAALVGCASAGLILWRICWPGSFARWAGGPARNAWRARYYRHRWAGVLAIAGIAPWHRGRVIMPKLGKVTATAYVDRVPVRLVSGQSAADFAKAADALAHGFGALLCRVRSARPGMVVLEFVRRDALAAVVPAPPVPFSPDLRALPVGRREDGGEWFIRLHGTHLLIAGATGAGKASLLWGLVRAMFPLLQTGMARVLAADPKLMELAYGRVIFETYGQYAAAPHAIADMLDQAVADMQARAARFAGIQRDHAPTTEDPFTVVLVDEVAFLTAYQPDRKLRERIMNALATLTTQGRAVGYCVVAALQDPRKDVLTIRNLFPDRIAMRLDEPAQVDMVLGDGARDRGAACELIPADPAVGAGIAYVRLETETDPVRVRAGWVTDTDIRGLADQCLPIPVDIPRWPEVAA
jgi:S-DNA-T family DNA segregation ATPase FtsK/SpoIIIE